MLFKFVSTNNIQFESIVGEGTGFFERDGNIRSIFIENTSSNTASINYYPNLNYSETHNVSLVNETSTSAIVASGVPFLGNNKSKIVYTLGSDVVATIYYSLPHIGG